jgi:hypothetical protein
MTPELFSEPQNALNWHPKSKSCHFKKETDPIKFYVVENHAKSNFWCTMMKSVQIQENRMCNVLM